MPHITAIYAALGTLLVLGLALRIVLYRRAHRIGLGDGGDRELLKRVRVHGNAIENLPLALVLLMLVELRGAAPLWVHAFGIALILARVLHAFGLSRSSGVSVGRFGGSLLTWLVMGAMALLLLVHALPG